MKIIPLEGSNLDDAIDFAARLNHKAAHNISYFGKTETEIKTDFTAIQPPEGYGFIALSDNGQTIGLFGVEIDTELGRCWLFGPLVDHENWDSIAGLLFDEVLADLPAEINDQELYCGNQNNRVQEFAIRQGFTLNAEGAVLTLDVSQYDQISATNVQDFDEKRTAEFNALHSSLFPNTYYSAEQLINLAEDPDKRIFIHIQNGKLAGYVFIQVRESSKDGYIDFIGVDETVRRQGIGQHLVTGTLNWVQTFPFVDKVTLTVKTDNVPAMRMYAALGFLTESVSQSYRKRT